MCAELNKNKSTSPATPERVGNPPPWWFKLICWLIALYFVGYSSFSLDPEMNWLARLIGFGAVFYFFPFKKYLVDD